MDRCERLSPGTYTFCKHTLLLDGTVREVFEGKWVTDPAHEGRHLYKFPVGTQVDGGTTMCIVNLKKPISINEYRAVKREGINPVMTANSDADVVSAILIVSRLAETLPNGL